MRNQAVHARPAVAGRLRGRRAEIEQAIATRIYSVSDPGEVLDSEYLQGLDDAVAAALDYALAVLEQGEGHLPHLPPALLSQARLAARNGVSLDTVLRRYISGFTLFGDFLMQEVESELAALGSISLRSLLRPQAVQFDELLGAVSEEYTRETERRMSSTEERRAARVRRLLEGEPLDLGEFDYEFSAWHLGLIAAGPDAAGILKDLAEACGHRRLSVRGPDGAIWVWLGAPHRIEAEELDALLNKVSGTRAFLAAGEPSPGVAGWRLTHRQARAALPIAQRSGRTWVRYSDVALLASMLSDQLLVASLRECYLRPLASGRGAGLPLPRTLHAYFEAERNISSAAAALGISRRTVANHLQVTEQLLGRAFGECAAELEAALRLERWERIDQSGVKPSEGQSVL